MNNVQQQVPMMVQRAPSAEEVEFAHARDRAVFAMDVLRLPDPATSAMNLNHLKDIAIRTLVEYLGRP